METFESIENNSIQTLHRDMAILLSIKFLKFGIKTYLVGGGMTLAASLAQQWIPRRYGLHRYFGYIKDTGIYTMIAGMFIAICPKPTEYGFRIFYPI